MHRFFIPPAWIHGERVYFQGDVAHQIHHVLHLRPGGQVVVLDNQGMEYLVELAMVSNSKTNGRVIAQRPAGGNPQTAITLYQSLTPREKFEWILQKCTELGISACVPVISSRSLVRSVKADDARKIQRWERILQEAAEQSGRGRVPVLGPVQEFSQALTAAAQTHQLCIMPWEGEQDLSLRSILEVFKRQQENEPGESRASIALFVGPEGGFSEQEVALARQAKVHTVSLGKRILRAETAAMTAVALTLYELGEMG